MLNFKCHEADFCPSGKKVVRYFS